MDSLKVMIKDPGVKRVQKEFNQTNKVKVSLFKKEMHFKNSPFLSRFEKRKLVPINRASLKLKTQFN